MQRHQAAGAAAPIRRTHLPHTCAASCCAMSRGRPARTPAHGMIGSSRQVSTRAPGPVALPPAAPAAGQPTWQATRVRPACKEPLPQAAFGLGLTLKVCPAPTAVCQRFNHDKDVGGAAAAQARHCAQQLLIHPAGGKVAGSGWAKGHGSLGHGTKHSSGKQQPFSHTPVDFAHCLKQPPHKLRILVVCRTAQAPARRPRAMHAKAVGQPPTCPSK